VTPIRLSLSLIALAVSTFAAAPTEDSRNVTIPHTDTHFRMPVYKSKADWTARASELRKQILWASGLDPMPKRAPLNPRYMGQIKGSGYTVDRVALETFPGYYLGGNLFRPTGKRGKLPAVLSPHGHWKTGRIEHTAAASVPARGINLARQGYVVFTYDMVGYNDTDQTPHRFGDIREMLWGFGPLGLQLWNSIRVLDFVESLPEVDRDRISVTGASGGGTQTFLLAAVDDRVKVTAPVNMISGIMQGGCVCENAPGLRYGTNNIEFGAMAAPRPLLMVSATGDWTRNTPNEEYPAVRSIYELFGKPEMVHSIQVDAPHNYNQQSREAVYRFFARHVNGAGDGANIKDEPIDLEDVNLLRVWQGEPKPANAISYEQLFDYWIKEARRQSEDLSAGEKLDRMRRALAVHKPSDVQVERSGERVVLYSPSKGHRIPGLLLGNGKISTIIVHDAGAAAGRSHASVERALNNKESVLLVDVFQTGEAIAPRDLKVIKHFLTFNKSDDAERVQDILTAVAYARSTNNDTIRITGIGKAAVWSAFAAAVAPGNWATATENPSAFRGSDTEFAGAFSVPGVQRAGGWAVVQNAMKWKN
jgi:dienelactone hydrolase